jgi:hypothetical protein
MLLISMPVSILSYVFSIAMIRSRLYLLLDRFNILIPSLSLAQVKAVYRNQSINRYAVIFWEEWMRYYPVPEIYHNWFLNYKQWEINCTMIDLAV